MKKWIIGAITCGSLVFVITHLNFRQIGCDPLRDGLLDGQCVKMRVLR